MLLSLLHFKRFFSYMEFIKICPKASMNFSDYRTLTSSKFYKARETLKSLALQIVLKSSISPPQNSFQSHHEDYKFFRLKNPHIFEILQSSGNFEKSCFTNCFEILDFASTKLLLEPPQRLGTSTKNIFILIKRSCMLWSLLLFTVIQC